MTPALQGPDLDGVAALPTFTLVAPPTDLSGAPPFEALRAMMNIQRAAARKVERMRSQRMPAEEIVAALHEYAHDRAALAAERASPANAAQWLLIAQVAQHSG